ncbi:hypothetical protein ACTJJ7_14620 [Phyllobacterium sp. 22229]|uniref:hypothetical protein n=1 Tax=Phyllobacterium TaxID=28100 RepID=UPI00102B3FC1|nr:hypothetical protein [Phyllobacterium myrsinacearum]
MEELPDKRNTLKKKAQSDDEDPGEHHDNDHSCQQGQDGHVGFRRFGFQYQFGKVSSTVAAISVTTRNTTRGKNPSLIFLLSLAGATLVKVCS